jgi:hypothetical protein
MGRTIKYLESAIAEAKREGLATVADPKVAANQAYCFLIGTALQAKVQNNLEVLRHVEPTVMAMIGASVAVPA